MKVLKFGGTSLGDATRMRQVASILQQEEDCIVVCSAMAGVTNTLIDTGRLWELENIDRALDLLRGLQQHFNKTCYELFPDITEATLSIDMLNGHFKKMESLLRTPYSRTDEYWLQAQGEIITSKLFTDFLNAHNGGFKLLNAFDFMHLGADGEPSLLDIHQRILRL